MYVEDWFSKTCPDTKPVDFDALPSCARDCVSDRSFDYGCITQGRNCFCLHASLFDCPQLCTDEKDVQKITDWFKSECQVDDSTAAKVANDSNYSFQFTSLVAGDKQNVVVRQSKKRELHWYEILVIFTAGLTLIVGGIWALLIYVLRRTWRKLLGYKDFEEQRRLRAKAMEEGSSIGTKGALD
jgi:hypothetical protein